MAYKEIPQELITFFKTFDTFYVIGHKEPDGDCLGSQLALASFLRRQGKKALLFSPGPFTRKEIRHHEKSFAERLTPEQKAASAGVVIMDCAALERIGDLAPDIEGRDIAVMDHHSAGDPDFGTIRYIDVKAPCVTLLVQKLIETFGDEPTTEEAYQIFCGFATDTGFFRHLYNEAAETLAMLGRLAAKGVSPRQIYRDTFGSYPLASRTFIADALKTAETHYEGRLIFVHELLEHSRRFRGENRQTDMVYQLLLSTEGCEALAFIREEEEGKTAVSLRSVDAIDVGLISRNFNGGGHKNAAGFTTALSYENIRLLLLESFAKIFPGS
jgi:phosphoesterase RecJ-like protein